ncbi:MAG: TetR/AcrR family transcriptional regulator [Sandarakinorhabdus sp.]|nr:TetR/AcrR family transcriptional regulator [Sandarakinorhabdus sp.]
MRTTPPSPADAIPDPTATTGNELDKSRETRRRILEAATACIAENGYQNFSTGAVAARAGLTRPAMLYHFGSRLDLLTATTRYAARQRILRFDQALRALPPVESHKGQYYRAKAASIAWDQLEEPYFWAFAELSIAARTNRNLEPIVTPTLAVFDAARRAVTDRALPPESFDVADFSLARDIVRFLSEGVALQDRFIEEREKRTRAMRHFLHMLVATSAGNDFLRIVTDDWHIQDGLPDGETAKDDEDGFTGTEVEPTERGSEAKSVENSP